MKIAEATAKAEDSQTSPSVGNVVADVYTKAQNARNARSHVEFEPAVKVVEATAKAEDAQTSPSVGIQLGMLLLMLRRLKTHGMRVLM